MPNGKGHVHTTATTRTLYTQDPNSTGSLRVPLQNLSDLRTRMDSLQRFISECINTNTPLSKHHMDTVSNEIASAIRHVIINGAALVAAGAPVFPVTPDPPATALPKNPSLNSKSNVVDEDNDGEHCEIVEPDAMELLAKHLHFCEVCGKGFTRDANLRMHMRAHGEQFKTPEALAKKPREGTRFMTTRFSCPFEGCNRHKLHKKFRPLKSVSCVRNHFKRTHCPKTHTCDRCRKKSFAVLSDLKSHARQCRGESTWKCSCGTTFSRKEKLFGHVALFEGHVPVGQEEEKGKQLVEGEDVDEGLLMKESDLGGDCLHELPQGFFDDLDEFGFGSVGNNCLQKEALGDFQII